MISRRGFIKGMLLASVAPAIVRADSLMRLIPTETTIIESSGFGLAAVKKEGASIIYDGCNAGNLWPGVKAWWAKSYCDIGDIVSLAENAVRANNVVDRARPGDTLIGVVVGRSHDGRVLVADDPTTIVNINRVPYAL